MSEHRLDVRIPTPADEILAVLEARPTTWLRPFLRLAAVHAARAPIPPGPPTWYRLGRPRDVAEGEVALTFSWWPHQRGGLFESFTGQFVVHSDHEKGVLLLEGVATGGSPARNAAVVQSLLELLGDAFAANQGPTPG